jgi:hypothetical protein
VKEERTMTDTAGSDVEQAAREYARDAFPLVPAERLFWVAGERITDFKAGAAWREQHPVDRVTAMAVIRSGEIRQEAEQLTVAAIVAYLRGVRAPIPYLATLDWSEWPSEALHWLADAIERGDWKAEGP